MKWFFFLFVAGSVPAQEVKLPLADFQTLRAEAKAPESKPSPPPIPAALEGVRATIEIDEHRARATQELTINLRGDAWHSLALPANGAFIEADFGEAEGRLAGGTSWTLHVRGEGRHQLKVVSVLGVKRDQRAARPTWTCSWRVPEAATIWAQILMAPSLEAIEAEGEAVLWQNPEELWLLVAQPGRKVTLRCYGSREEGQTGGETRFQVLTASAIGMSRNRLAATAHLDIKLAQGSVDRFHLPVPAGYEITRVKGEPEVNWQVIGGRLVLEPLVPITDGLSLAVRLTGEPDGRVRTPLLVPEGAARVRAYVSLRAGYDGMYELAELDRARAFQGPGRLPDGFGISGIPVYVVEDPSRPPNWFVYWAERTAVVEAQIDRLFVDVVAGEHGRANYQVWVEVRNAGLTNLEMDLPEGFELALAERNGQAAIPGGSGSRLIVPLNAAQDRQSVVIQGFIPLKRPEKGRLVLPLPAFTAPVAMVEVKLRAPGQWRAHLADKERKGRIHQWSDVANPGASSKLSDLILGRQRYLNGSGSIEPFITPVGYDRITAAWTALTPNPGSLVLEVKPKMAKKEWL